jgi:hypothetical protein
MIKPLISLLLSIIIAAPAGAVRFVPAARRAAPNVGTPVLNAPIFLRSLELHLDQTALHLGTELPGVSSPELAENSLTAAEYLSRQALGANSQDAIEAAPAARVAAAALADPQRRSETARLLRAGGGKDGARIAEKLEQLGGKAEALQPLALVGQDLASGVVGAEAQAQLNELFGERLGALAAPQVTPVESLALYAARRFSGGRLQLDQAPLVAASAKPEALPGDSDLQSRIELSPLTNAEREATLYDLFRQAGAAEDDIQMQDIGRGQHNLMVVKKGRSDRVVVVGGHHDKVHRGAGTIDNWTGATMVVNLYQAMRTLDTEATYVFMTFGREEEGLVGSRKYVRGLSRAERANIDAMINLDTLAVDGTFSWRNKSDRVLLDVFRRVADANNLDLKETTLWGGDSDQTSFRRAGIPGGMLYGASDDVIWDIIHSENDTVAYFSLAHYRNALQVALAALQHLDTNPVRTRFMRWLTSWVGRITSLWQA